jgi:hypothetical protein
MYQIAKIALKNALILEGLNIFLISSTSFTDSVVRDLRSESLNTKLLTFLLLLSACTDAENIDSRSSTSKSGDSKSQKTNASSATFIDIPQDTNSDVETSEGATVASNTTAAYLTMPLEHLETLTLPVTFSEAEGANYRDATQIRIHQETITESEREAMTAFQSSRADEKIVVFYHCHAPLSSLDGLYVVGVIPPTRVERNGSSYTFFLEGGYGTYQVAKVVPEKGTTVIEAIEPKLTVTEIQKPSKGSRTQQNFEAPDDDLLPESLKKKVKEKVTQGVQRQSETNAKREREKKSDGNGDQRDNGNKTSSSGNVASSNSSSDNRDRDNDRDDDDDEDGRGNSNGNSQSGNRNENNGQHGQNDSQHTVETIDRDCPAGFVFIEETKIEVATATTNSNQKSNSSKWKKKDGVNIVTVPDFCVMHNEARTAEGEAQDIATGTGALIRDLAPRDAEALRAECARNGGSHPLTVYQTMAIARRIATEGQNFVGRDDDRHFRTGMIFSVSDVQNAATTARCPAGSNCGASEAIPRGHFVSEETRIFDFMGGINEYVMGIDGALVTFNPDSASSNLTFVAAQSDAAGISLRCTTRK